MLYKTLRIAENQRVFWFRDGDFQKILEPGKYRFWTRLAQNKFVSFDISESECVLPNANFLWATHASLLGAHLAITVIGENEVGLVSVNKQAKRLALPGEIVAFWRGAQQGMVDTIDLSSQVEVPARWIQSINRSGERMELASLRKALQAVSVDEGFESIMLVDGRVDRTLQPGRYGFWKIGRDIKVLAVDKRVQEIEVNGQEILTRDRVSLRTNAALQYRVSDSLQAMVETSDVMALAYRAVQFALRRAIGAMTLDELLADKSKLGEIVQSDVSAELAQAGIAVAMVGIKDVILPGEMKTILNQVVEAEKVSEANTIRRRDETQNVRALANTARQLESNPMMARLKELEALQTVTASVSTLNVYDGLNGVMDQLVKLKPE